VEYVHSEDIYKEVIKLRCRLLSRLLYRKTETYIGLRIGSIFDISRG